MATGKTLRAGRMSRFVLCLTAICLLTCCTMLSVRRFDNDFDGLNAAASRANSAGGTLRILFVHGMGHYQPGYSQPLMQGIAARLNLSDTGSSRRITIRKESHDYGEINIANYSSSEGKKVRAYELTWSATTDALKARQFASDATYASSRVLVNRQLKAQLIDDALADPVLYIGRYRNHMQFPLMRAIVAILHDYEPQDELANQLPLLELSEVSNPLPLRHASATAVKALAEIRRQNKPRARLQRPQAPLALHLVAFS